MATVRAPVRVPSSDSLPGPEAVHLPEVEITRLGPRLPAESLSDLFASQSWEALDVEEARRNAPPPPPPAPPQAPPLPLLFIGKLIDGGTSVIFLANGDRNYSVRLGDTVDGVYRVEEIGDRTMTLVYLPLQSEQQLAIGTSSAADLGAGPAPEAVTAEAPLPLRPTAPPTHDLNKLVWIAPPQVEIGEEFTIEVGLPAGPQPRTGRVELAYDGLVLAMLGGASTGPTTADGAGGRRAIVDLIGPGFPGGQPTPTEVRFQVLAANPLTTRIRIENLSAVNASGGPLIVESPPGHQLAVVQSKAQDKPPAEARSR